MRAKYYFVLMAAAIALLAGCTTSKEAASPPVTVIDLRGGVQYSVDGTNWLAVKRGQIVGSGTMIRTMEKGMVDLRIGEAYEQAAASHHSPNDYSSVSTTYISRGDFENTVRVFGTSELTIDKLSAKRVGTWFDERAEVLEVSMTLRSGNMVGQAGTWRAPSTHEVKFGNWTLKVVGGNYGIDSSNIVSVLRGEAVVSGGGMEAVTIKRLRQYDPATRAVTRFPLRPIQ